jgi:hypothetical protein
VVGIFRIWTGVPDVVYLAGNFSLQTEKIFALPLQICVSLKFTDKNFKQPNCLFCVCWCYVLRYDVCDVS